MGINYVLHCVPGKLEDKFDILFNNIPNTNYNLFGATVVNDLDKQTKLSKLEINYLNKFKIFNNLDDYSFNIIKYFNYKNLDYQTEIYGNVLVFSIKV